MNFDLLVENGTVVFLIARPRADVAIRDGRFAALLEPGAGASAAKVVDASGQHVFPGLIDCHVHFGFGEKITEYTTETVYAAQGGFTTIIGYFLNNEAYDAVYAREMSHARSVATSTSAFTSRPRTSCIARSCRATSRSSASPRSSTS
jgi:dihydropyrimidinase